MHPSQPAGRPATPSSFPVAGTAGASAVRDGDRLVYRRDGFPDAPVVGACLSLTSRCNEACPMCLEDRDPARAADLPLDAAVALAARFTGAVAVVNGTASESLLHPGFLQLCREVRARGSAMGVLTNGLALARPGFLAECADAGLRQVTVSCHTPDPVTFGRLTGVPRSYGDFVAALEALDTHNRTAPAGGEIAIIVQVVLMRPLSAELDALLAFVERRLAHSRASLRIETFRPINSAARHRELQPDLAEVSSLVGRILAGSHLPAAFRHVPLCALPGAEHLASEVGQILRREKTLGNPGYGSTAIVEQARARSAVEDLGFESCVSCPVALACPGVSDIPHSPGAATPRPPEASLREVAGRLHPSICGAALDEAARVARAELLGDPAERFDAADVPLLASLLRRLSASGLTTAATLRRIDVDLADPDQPGGSARVVVVPATVPGPRYRRFRGCAVGYNGVLSRRVRDVVEGIGRHLERGSA